MANSSHAIPPKDWLNSIFHRVVGPTCWPARTRGSASLPIKSLQNPPLASGYSDRIEKLPGRTHTKKFAAARFERWNGISKNASGTPCGRFPLAGRKATAKSRKRLASPKPSAPWVARAGRIRYQFLCHATASWRRTKNWAASPADWIGNAVCSRGKALIFDDEFGFDAISQV